MLFVLSFAGIVLLAAPVLASAPEHANRFEKPTRHPHSVEQDVHANAANETGHAVSYVEAEDQLSTPRNVGREVVDVPRSVEGNNGTLKVHEIGTPSGTENNDPKVCAFNLEGFGFDDGQSGYIQFSTQGKDAPVGVAPEAVYSFGPTNSDGYALSRDFNNGSGTVRIANGHYKATLYGKDTSGAMNLQDVKAKSKVFKVTCETSTIPSNPPVPPTPNQGGSGSVLGSTTVVSNIAAKTSTLQNTGSNVVLSTLMTTTIVVTAWLVMRKQTTARLTQEDIELMTI